MTEQEYLELAKEFAAKEGCDIVRAAGEEDGWHYFAYTKSNLPHYSSLPRAMRISPEGKVEKLTGFLIRQTVSNRAFLKQSDN